MAQEAHDGDHSDHGSGEHTVFLGLGSNLGDRAAHLRAALEALAPYVDVTWVSSIYETAPMYVEDQPSFYNLACGGQTRLPSAALLRELKQIERALGRAPGPRYGPRVVDLDLLLFDDLVLASDALTLPHPRMLERAFVLVPLAEIAPHQRHPVARKTIAALAAALPTAGVRRIGPLFSPVE
jgi:2-amino-4-hydroxy-6-hydroxymethyldihydropteridine diphosphokinase